MQLINQAMHICYYDDTNKDIEYATNASGTWITETVVNGENIEGGSSSIAIDSSDKIHISYIGEDIRYLTYTIPGM